MLRAFYVDDIEPIAKSHSIFFQGYWHNPLSVDFFSCLHKLFFVCRGIFCYCKAARTMRLTSVLIAEKLMLFSFSFFSAFDQNVLLKFFQSIQLMMYNPTSCPFCIVKDFKTLFSENTDCADTFNGISPLAEHFESYHMVYLFH